MIFFVLFISSIIVSFRLAEKSITSLSDLELEILGDNIIIVLLSGSILVSNFGTVTSKVTLYILLFSILSMIL